MLKNMTVHPVPYMGFMAASVASLAFGAIFYSDMMFHHVWTKFSNRAMSKGPRQRLLLRGFIFNLLAAITLAKLLDAPATLTQAIIRGVVIAGGVVVTSLFHNYTFSSVNSRIFLLDGFYYLLQFGLMAGVLQACGSPKLLTQEGLKTNYSYT